MSYGDLARMGVVIRPYDNPPPSGETHSPFEARFGNTVSLLARELRHLDAETIVLQLGFRDRDLRVDGLPRANARMDHDAVALSFDSKHGPLRYETNEFIGRYYREQIGWQANLRAIALGMEALRKVDRYAISKRGEQYRGWRQIESSTDAADSIVTAAQAGALLDSYGGLVAAIKATHPDHGGDETEFRKVIRAKEILA